MHTSEQATLDEWPPESESGRELPECSLCGKEVNSLQYHRFSEHYQLYRWIAAEAKAAEDRDTSNRTFENPKPLNLAPVTDARVKTADVGDVDLEKCPYCVSCGRTVSKRYCRVFGQTDPPAVNGCGAEGCRPRSDRY